jgi:hypothetical protein
VNQINNILLSIQTSLMIYSLYLLFSKWHDLQSLKWLIINPIAGLCQFVFSLIIYPIIIRLQTNENIKDLLSSELKSQNLLLIAAYGIIEYYSICRFLGDKSISRLFKKIIFHCSNITIIICFLSLLFLPNDNIFIKKFITVFLSFQLIFFSVFRLSEFIFNENEDKIEKDPIFIITGSVFILFNSTCPVYYISGYFAVNFIPESEIINIIILISYTCFYSILIYTTRWIKT